MASCSSKTKRKFSKKKIPLPTIHPRSKLTGYSNKINNKKPQRKKPSQNLKINTARTNQQNLQKQING